MSSIPIRRATPSDLPAMAALAADLVRMHHAQDAHRFMLPEEVEAGYRWWFDRELARTEAELWVAELDGIIVGYVYGTLEERDWNALLDPHGAIHDLYVAPAHRRSGAGAGLLAAIVGAFEARGHTRIVLSTMVSNLAAQSLFKAHGFRPTMLEMTRGSDAPKPPTDQ